MALLEVENLSVAVATADGLLPVVREISFKVPAGGSLGIVGESGCGKSLTALAVMGLTEGTAILVAGAQSASRDRTSRSLPVDLAES